mmetsp:Transcript_6112/g.17104  ORF Transcript_6112/g.17104 Transcript_6112/m.17104 type:complete len:155 (+) Transcript_6112:1280-1744(+)
MTLMGVCSVSSSAHASPVRVSSPLRTMPKVPLPRNSPNSNWDGWIVDDAGGLNAVVPANSGADKDADVGGELFGPDGTKPHAHGRRRTSRRSSIGHRGGRGGNCNDTTPSFCFDWTVIVVLNIVRVVPTFLYVTFAHLLARCRQWQGYVAKSWF